MEHIKPEQCLYKYETISSYRSLALGLWPAVAGQEHCQLEGNDPAYVD